MKRLTGLLAVLLAMVCMPAAQAALEIDFSFDGGPRTFLAVGPDTGPVVVPVLPIAVPGGAFTVTVLSANSNSPGTPTLADVMSATLTVSNTGSGTHTLELFIGAQNFTAPTAPPNPALLFSSHIGGSVTTGSPTNVLRFTSCVDPTNSLMTWPVGAPIVAGPGTPNIKVSASSFSDDKFTTIGALGAGFSIEQDIVLTLGSGSILNFSTNSQLTPVPEPISISLLGGVILLVIGSIRRKRNQAHQV